MAGDISGSGALEKLGSGTLILEGTNSYEGDTIVEGGTLVATVAGAIPGGGALIVGAGGTFIFDPSQVIAAQLNSAASEINPVPEPEVWTLLATAVFGAGVYRRIRSRRRKP